MFRRLLGRLWPGHESVMPPAHVTIALAFVLPGAAITTPGVKEAIMGGLNKAFALGLSLDVPWYIGPPMMLIGVGVFVFGEHRKERPRAAAPSAGSFVALRHQSLELLAGRLAGDDVPSRLRNRSLKYFDCDQSAFLSGGSVDPIGAVRQQMHMAADLAAVRRADPDTALGYYGIVHVPLQFLAGCSVSTLPEMALFELDRATNRWRELAAGVHPDVGLTVESLARPANAVAVVVRIAVSYEIPLVDVVDVVTGPFEDIRIGIAKPRIDAITHYGQIEIIAAAFRGVLDDLHARLGKAQAVHVFYAGPVSLGFSLGRRISRTIHHRVIVYNYTARTRPRYAWGVEVNGGSGAAPEAVVLRPPLRDLGGTEVVVSS
jgi:hypothetical protein